MENQELAKIKDVLLRRKWWLILPLILTILVTGIVCVLLPNTYKSTATILIHNQQIPASLVPSTITSYAQERIQSIAQEVTSRSRTLNLVEKYDLLKEKRKKLSTEDLVEEVRKRITLQTINAEVNSERGGAPIQLTIAFSLSYEDESPKTAQAVTNEIASFYLEKNVEARTKHARGTTEFLQEQLKLEKDRIDGLQSRLAEFQKEHLEELPQFSTLNMQKLEKLNSNISEINMQIRSLEEQRSTLKGNIALLDPYSGNTAKVLTASERLQQAQLELANLLSRYSDGHPAVQAKKQELSLLENNPTGAALSGEAGDQLTELESKLAALRSRYSEQHPDVQSTLREIEKVKREGSSRGRRNAAGSKQSGKATNPAYVSLQADLDKISVSISSLSAERSRYEKQIKEVYEKLQSMPQVAKVFMDLDTEYQIAKAHYNDIQQKLLAARVSQGMEEEQLGESFQVIEPAFLPEKPFKPNRLAIMLIGVVLGFGFSVGMVSLKELTDKRIRDANTLEKIAGLRVISAIPHIVTAEDLAASRRKKLIAGGSTLCCIVASVMVFHFLIMDLDVFYAKIERVVSRKIP